MHTLIPPQQTFVTTSQFLYRETLFVIALRSFSALMSFIRKTNAACALRERKLTFIVHQEPVQCFACRHWDPSVGDHSRGAGPSPEPSIKHLKLSSTTAGLSYLRACTPIASVSLTKSDVCLLVSMSKSVMVEQGLPLCGHALLEHEA